MSPTLNDGQPLPEQFAALPEELQSRLFHLTDILRSMDQAQGLETGQAEALAASPLVSQRPFLKGLISQLAHIVMWHGCSRSRPVSTEPSTDS